MSTLIKTFFTFYTTEFYSLTDQLQLRVKRVADWVKCNIIHPKISQNSRTYKMKNTWWNEKHMTLKSHSIHCVLNKACDLILMSVCVRYFLNLKLCQCWSDWFSCTCTWVCVCSWQLLSEYQLDDWWAYKSYIWKINLLI